MKSLSIQEQKVVIGGKWAVLVTDKDGKYVTRVTFWTRKEAQIYAIGVNKSGLMGRVIEQW